MHLFQVSLHMYPLPQDALVPSVITHIGYPPFQDNITFDF